MVVENNLLKEIKINNTKIYSYIYSLLDVNDMKESLNYCNKIFQDIEKLKKDTNNDSDYIYIITILTQLFILKSFVYNNKSNLQVSFDEKELNDIIEKCLYSNDIRFSKNKFLQKYIKENYK